MNEGPNGNHIELPNKGIIRIRNTNLEPHITQMFEAMCQAAGVTAVKQGLTGYDLIIMHTLSATAKETLTETLQDLVDQNPEIEISQV